MKKKIVLAAAAAMTGLGSTTWGAAILPGDLVVYRVGSGAAALSSAGTAVFLDEYSPTGTLVQSIAAPTATSGINFAAVASGTATSEGGLSLSPNGQYVGFGGYDAAVGTASVASSATTAVPRVAGLLNVATGNVDTSTNFTSFTGNNIRSVVTSDGTNIFAAGAAGGVIATTDGTTTAAATAPVTIISTTTTGSPPPGVSNVRQVSIFGGQLYLSTGSGTAFRIAAIGSGVSTAATQSLTEIAPVGVASNASTAGTPVAAPYEFLFTTLDGSATPDVLYVADNGYSTSGTNNNASMGTIEKYTISGGNLTLDGTVPLVNLTGITGETITTGPTTTEELFATTPTGIYELTDTGSASALSGTPTLIASAATNEAFRGIVALAPVPEPTGLAFLAVGGLSLLRRRR